MPPTQPSVPRDTRLLLAIVLISVAVLWVLARIRFPERPPTPNPVPPVLAQLAPPSAFDDIVATVSRLQPRLAEALVLLDLEEDTVAPASRRGRATALRFRDDLGLTLLPRNTRLVPARTPDSAPVDVARDRASGLAVVHLAGPPAETVAVWSPRRLDAPRFVMAATAADGPPVVRPLLVPEFREESSPIWSSPIWAVPSAPDLPAGTFVFTSDGALAGLAIDRGGRPALVPGAVVLASAERLLAEHRAPAGWFGIDVQPLTPGLSAATGSSAGVVVTWVDPHGPAAGQILPTDVVEQIDGFPLQGLDWWRAHVDRVAAGTAVAMRLRRSGALMDVRVIATSAPQPPLKRPLGLTLRSVHGVGTVVVRVEPGSAAAQAGIRPDDVLTLIGETASPTAAQASRLFADARADRPTLVAVTRGNTHLVIALERTW